MQSSPELTRTSLPAPSSDTRQTALLYQTVTIAAMFLLICSMWIF
jgi:hypothetical protein